MNEKIKSDSRHYNRILTEIDHVYHEIALKQGYSDSTMSILYVLSDNGGSCLLSTLVAQTGISKQTINSALRKLESEDIIFLKSAGGKAKRVLLTDKGKIVVHETTDRVIAMENKIYSSWAAEEWELYMKLTERYLQQLKEEMKELSYEHSTF